MNEKPILFCADMVSAILEGRKTQTRRLQGLEEINGNPDLWQNPIMCKVTKGLPKKKLNILGVMMQAVPARWIDNDKPFSVFLPCPYAVDRLWVKETFCLCDAERSDGHKAPLYRATSIAECVKWRPSIFMPRWASRINLAVKNIRVERLREITEEDAKAEGTQVSDAAFCSRNEEVVENLYRDEYRKLWESINGKDSWKTNPWLWVIEFEREG